MPVVVPAAINAPVSPPNAALGGAVPAKSAALDFLKFKNKAKEKLDKQRQLIEQQEQRRHQKEQVERERLRVETEKRREKEEEEALEKARLVQSSCIFFLILFANGKLLLFSFKGIVVNC
jgi:hypothetical protein